MTNDLGKPRARIGGSALTGGEPDLTCPFDAEAGMGMRLTTPMPERTAPEQIATRWNGTKRCWSGRHR
jgi:hypothetical protein